MMKKNDIKKHLKEYSIYQKRKTTINHAFASALSIPDTFNDEILNQQISKLHQDPESDLKCAYCDDSAESWDHIQAVVKNGEFSGYGHQINNLIPCCKSCNSKKGNKDWEIFIKDEGLYNSERVERIRMYISGGTFDLRKKMNELCAAELSTLENIKLQIFQLLKEADEVVKVIKSKVKSN